MSIMDVPVPHDAEIGHPGGHAESYHHELGPGYIARGYEETAELEFPHSISVFDRMRKTEGQIAAVLRAIFLPILANARHYATDGVSDQVRRLVETELLLDDDKQAGRTARTGVLLREHLAEALLAVPLGFVPFNRWFRVAPPSTDQQALGIGGLIYHLGHPGIRLPRTVQEIRVHANGDLAGIIQAGIGWDTSGRGSGVQVIGGPNPFDNAREIWIPADQLIYYCYQREGADWTGSSILRSAYKDWLLKEELIRTNALAAERNGMGLPMVYYTDAGTREEALSIAQGMRAGAYAGAAVPDGKYRVELLGVTGQVKDLLPSIKYHDEAMGRSALAMFLNLGHDAGLGSGQTTDAMRELFVDSLNALDEWLCEVVTEQIIRPLVAANFGPDEPYPVLCGDELTADGPLTAEGLKALRDAGLLDPDPVLKAELRRRHRLPAAEDVPEIVEAPGFTDAPEDLDPHAMEPGTDPAVQGPPPAAAPRDGGGAGPSHDPGAMDPVLAGAERLVKRIAALRAGGHV